MNDTCSVDILGETGHNTKVKCSPPHCPEVTAWNLVVFFPKFFFFSLLLQDWDHFKIRIKCFKTSHSTEAFQCPCVQWRQDPEGWVPLSECPRWGSIHGGHVFQGEIGWRC